MGHRTSFPAVKWPARPADWVRLALAVALVGLVYYAYWVQHIEDQFTCSTWLQNHWTAAASNYSHGPLVPLIALGLVAWKWRALGRAEIHPKTWGAVVVAAAMILYYLGTRALVARIVVVSFIVLLYGLVLALAGPAPFRLLFFPITFLLLMIPLNFLDELIGFRLQLMMAWISTAFLNGIGIETIRIGTSIRSTVFNFDVANPCSGIRSMMALATVTAAFAYVTQRRQWKRWVLFLSAFPLAVLGNLFRVLTIALIGQVYGSGPAMAAHDYSGFIVFAVALAAMITLGLLLNLPYRRLWEQCRQPLTSPATVPNNLPSTLSEESHE